MASHISEVNRCQFPRAIQLWLIMLFVLLLLMSSGVCFAAKCVYIASYHHGYEWNDGIERGIDDVLSSACEIHKFFMDTKRNNDLEFINKKSLEAKAFIEKIQPDVVIASDDNASKYVIQPFYKDAKTPFVFCGVNWTVESYGYPYTNVTGMIEAAPILPLLKEIRKIVKRPTKGIYLSADVLTEHKDFARYRKNYADDGVGLQGIFVKTMAQWKAQYKKAQASDANFIILNNNSGINDWVKSEAKQFVLQHAEIFTVTNYQWMMAYAMFAMTKVPEEQGEWAAKVALAILDGHSASDIPIVVNRQWNTYVNPELLQKAHIQLPTNVLNKAIKVTSHE